MNNIEPSAKRKSIQLTRASKFALDDIETHYIGHRHELPFVACPVSANIELVQWVKANRNHIESQLLLAGGVLFRGFVIGGVERFENVIETHSGSLLDYSYRSTPRTRVSGRIYTSTEYPPHQTIPFHNEKAYALSWPMKLWFYSVQVAPRGGETPISDCRRVYKDIPPDIKDCFVRKGLMYVRNYGTGLDLPWQEVFQTSSKAVVADYCRRAHIELEWVDDDQLRTRQRCQVVAQHPKTGESVWFNQAHLLHASRLPAEVRDWLLCAYGEEGLPRNVYFADGSPIDPEMLDEISTVYENNAVVFTWQAGDVLLLDNMLAAHGRRPFVGKRRVVVGMAEPNTIAA
jgi:alpha-ketoglutarate-dependent taurine dioxygenase